MQMGEDEGVGPLGMDDDVFKEEFELAVGV